MESMTSKWHPKQLLGMVLKTIILVHTVRGYEIPTDKCSGKFLNISVSLTIVSILDVIEQSQEIRLHQRLDMCWYDAELHNTNESDSTRGLYFVEARDICFPEMLNVGSINVDTFHWRNFNHEVTVDTRNGMVKVMLPNHYAGRCTMKMEHYPFDAHVCYISPSTSARDKSMVEMNPVAFRYLEELDAGNQGWRLTQTKMVKAVVSVDGTSRSHAVFVFVIQRIPSYYLVHMVIPIVIVCFVAIVGFFNPSSSTSVRQDKVRLGMMALLAIAVQMVAVQDKLPVSSSIPAISKFYLGIIGLISAGAVVTIIIIRIQRRCHVNETIYKVTTGPLATYFCIPSHAHCSQEKGGDRRCRKIFVNNTRKIKTSSKETEETEEHQLSTAIVDSHQIQDLDLFCQVLDCLFFCIFCLSLFIHIVWFLSHYNNSVDVTSGEFEHLLTNS